MAVIAGLMYPLWMALDELLTRQRVHRHLVALRYERPALYQSVVMRRLNVDVVEETIRVDVEAICPRDFDFDVSRETERIRKYLAEKMGKKVEVKSTVIFAEVIESDTETNGDS